MTATVILNAVFAVFVVVGIVSLLTWAILTDRGSKPSLPRRSRQSAHGTASSPAQRRQAALTRIQAR